MIPYFGGKSKISNWINGYLPKGTTYCEPFGGAFWNYIKGDFDNFDKIIYNDLNKYIYNLVNCVSKDPERLLSELKKDRHKVKSIYNKYHEELFPKKQNKPISFSSPDYGIAHKYVYILTHTFSGTNPVKGSFVLDTHTDKYKAFQKKLEKEEFVEKFKKVKAFNMDFEKCVEKHDSKDTVFYLDPPYKGNEDKYHLNTFQDNDHERLYNVLKNIKGKFLLSYYDFPDLKKFYPSSKYNVMRKSFTKQAGFSSGGTKGQATEVLITNFDKEKKESLKLKKFKEFII